MSLQWRVALALAAIAAAATFSVGWISYRATGDRLLEEVDRSLYQALVTTVATLRRGNPTRSVLDFYVIQTLDRSGQFTYSNRDGIGPGPGYERVIESEAELSYDTFPTAVGDVRMLSLEFDGGVMQVGRMLNENDRVLDDLRARTIWVVALVTAATAAVGWLTARTVTAPLKRLTRAATDVERSGRLDVDVPVSGRDEVGQLGTAFNGMLGALAASRADQQRLVEDAGHELRTPLTSVRTNLAVLRRHPDLDPATRQRVLDDLEVETEELVALVEEVVALARGVTEDAPAEPFVLADVARAVAGRAQRRHGRPIVVHADGSEVEAPPAAVERAISNLVDNAAKFDETGGPIDVVVADGAVVVHDRGPGIALEDRERVFDRFYRAEAARALPGSGLGLSIVREVAERNGGSVHLAERPGGGASVGFTLRRAAGPPAAPLPEPTPSSFPGPSVAADGRGVPGS